MRLYDFLDKLDKGFYLRIIGYDNGKNITWKIWQGYKWQLIIEGVCENCDIIVIRNGIRDRVMEIEVDRDFDALEEKRVHLWH